MRTRERTADERIEEKRGGETRYQMDEVPGTVAEDRWLPSSAAEGKRPSQLQRGSSRPTAAKNAGRVASRVEAFSFSLCFFFDLLYEPARIDSETRVGCFTRVEPSR